MNKPSEHEESCEVRLAGGVPPVQGDPLSTNQRVGLKLFAIYCLAYGAFIALNVAGPQLMPVPVVAGVNLAIIFGLGLILLAFALSLVYLGIAKFSRDASDNG